MMPEHTNEFSKFNEISDPTNGLLRVISETVNASSQVEKNSKSSKYIMLSVLTQVIIRIIRSFCGISYLLILFHHTCAKHPENRKTYIKIKIIL